MSSDADELEDVGNHPEPLPKGVADDLSGGLSQIELAKRFGYADPSKVCREGKNANFAEWSKSKDPDRIAWRRDGEGRKCRYFPVD